MNMGNPEASSQAQEAAKLDAQKDQDEMTMEERHAAIASEREARYKAFDAARDKLENELKGLLIFEDEEGEEEVRADFKLGDQILEVLNNEDLQGDEEGMRAAINAIQIPFHLRLGNAAKVVKVFNSETYSNYFATQRAYNAPSQDFF